MFHYLIALRKKILFVLGKALSILPHKVLNVIIESSLQGAQDKGPDFLTLHRRPKSGAASRTSYLPVLNPNITPPTIGLIIQGAIRHEDNFTLESVHYYRQSMPSTQIIVSTWEDEAPEILTRLKDAGAIVVTSVKPKVSGAINVNFQTRSTLSGIQRARELGCDYVAKSRSDQRIYAPNILVFLYELLVQFPLKNESNQTARLLTTNFATMMFIPFYFADQFMFGATDDMEKYWSPPDNQLTTRIGFFGKTIRQVIESDVVPEIFLTQHYLTKIGVSYSLTLAESWRALANHFIVIDREWLDSYWPKYAPHNEYADRDYSGASCAQTVRFLDWLRLYQQYSADASAPEHLLDEPFDKAVSLLDTNRDN